MGKRVALSWSGGKDSCMALDLLVKQGYEVACLITTVPKEIGRTFGHDEKTEWIERQSNALSLPLHFVRCSLDRYTETFIEDLVQLKERFQLEGIAFGDIYLDGHREWGENVAAAVGLPALYPLWSKEEDSLQLLQNFIQSGYKAMIIRLRLDVLDDAWLGRQLDEDFYVDIQSQDLCPMGEHGEFHTFVYDGPLFHHPIHLTHGKIVTSERSKRLDICAKV
ncbi:diphthine--ammonia ligase [Bacillus sp. FJAT-42315]|uniref:Dph6-related ATP pyrophosphatase n=1 Tax=Bacillus sp. FJAT-42315 TaxID=2014077 RepID=UPI000C2452A3|nr:diphthine--ammonia ligase [Bacillus sp. FJAT-42315]